MKLIYSQLIRTKIIKTFCFQNMFLAIINDTYAEVKIDVMSRKADFQVGDFFKTGVNNVKGYLGILDRYN